MAGLEQVEILEMQETHVLIVEPQTAVKGLQQALASEEIEVTESSAVGDLRVPAAAGARVHDIIRGMNVIPKVTQIKSPKTTTLAV